MAQEEADSVWVEGSITEARTGRAPKFCEVQMLQEGEVRAVAYSDTGGYYTIGWLAIGHYAISVVSDGRTLHYAEMELTENAMLNIVLLSDTLNTHTLKPAEVTAWRKGQVYIPITSPDDPRLWNMSGKMEGGPASLDLSGGKVLPKSKSRLTPLYAHRPEWLDKPFHSDGKYRKRK